MAGPTASVLLSEPVSADQVQQLRAWLGPICDGNLSTFLDWHPLYIRDCEALDLPPGDCAHPCTFGIEAGEPWGELEETWESIIAELGYFPEGSIGIWMGCNQDQDHRLLARLALSIAERFGGVVDMNGSIPITFPPQRFWQASPVTPDEIGAEIQRIGGTVYTISDDEGHESHIVDAAFLRSWLEHPYFRMVK